MGGNVSIPLTANKRSKSRRRKSHAPLKGNFLLTLYWNSIKIVNACQRDLDLIGTLVRSNSRVSREEWVRPLTYLFQMKNSDKICLIRLVSAILFFLHKIGWDPLAPFTSQTKSDKHHLTTICFSRRYDNINDDILDYQKVVRLLGMRKTI